MEGKKVRHDDCGDCKNMQETTYWSHFKFLRFIQKLSGNYQEQLAIPENFVKNLGEKLLRKVSLKVPSGATWDVGIEMIGGTVCIKTGWKEFVEHNSLQENDILVFTYDSVINQFDILLFGGKNLCEKVSSYFVRTCAHQDQTPRGVKTNHEQQTFSSSLHEQEKNESSDDDVIELTPSTQLKRTTRLRKLKQVISAEVKSESSSEDVTEWTLSKRPKKVYTEIVKSVGHETKEFMMKTRGRKPSCSNSRVNARNEEYVSNRRPVTEEEKKSAVQKANLAASPDSLVVVMYSSQVCRLFYVTLPAWWANDRMPQKSVDVIVRHKSRKWKMKYMSRGRGGMLTTGWKNFALDNLLEEFDVCLLKLAGEEGGFIVMDISIFRVVEEAVPRTPPFIMPRKPGRPKTN